MSGSIVVFHEILATGTMNGIITVPNDVHPTLAYFEVILSAPVLSNNVFNIDVTLDVEEPGPGASKSWRRHDRTLITRDLPDAVNPVAIAAQTRVPAVAGKRVRAAVALGQNTCAVSVVLKWPD